MIAERSFEMDNTDNTDAFKFSLDLLNIICAAAGDPEGKLTPIELVAKIRRMRGALQHVLDEEMSNEKAVYEFGGYTLGEEIRTKITDALK